MTSAPPATAARRPASCRTRVAPPSPGAWSATVHLDQAGARIDAQLVGEQGPGALVRAERVTLPSAAVERRHEHLPEPSLVGMVTVTPARSLGDGLGGTAQGEVRGDPVLGDRKPNSSSRRASAWAKSASNPRTPARARAPAPHPRCGRRRRADHRRGPAAHPRADARTARRRPGQGPGPAGTGPVGEQDCWKHRTRGSSASRRPRTKVCRDLAVLAVHRPPTACRSAAVVTSRPEAATKPARSRRSLLPAPRSSH